MEWKHTEPLVAYEDGLAQMEQRVADVVAGKADELVWLLEHPPLFTGGTSAKPEDLMNPMGLPVYDVGRGGEYTYHGPGQRVAYVVKRLEHQDLRRYVFELEDWVIQTLAAFGVQGERRERRVGIWVQDSKRGEAKIAAIGVRIRKWVAYHGIAINLDPDLSHFGGIVPCGIKEFGVTSLRAIGKDVTMQQLDAALKEQFAKSVS